LINPRHKPRNRMFRGCKHDFVLEDMIKIDVPATIAVKDGDGSIAIYIGHELLAVRTLMHLHGHASSSSLCPLVWAFRLPRERAHTAPFYGYAHETMQVSPQCLFLQEHCSGRHTLIGTTTKSWIRAHGKVFGHRSEGLFITRSITDALMVTIYSSRRKLRTPAPQCVG
jgi:hypothetical protein